MNNDDRELDFALAEAEQENRLLRARNERLENTVVEYEQLIRDLTDALRAHHTWVGLTDEEVLKFQDIVPSTLSHDLIEFARAIEAKLKEKNT